MDRNSEKKLNIDFDQLLIEMEKHEKALIEAAKFFYWNKDAKQMIFEIEKFIKQQNSKV
jgi:uncharacterized protein YccT (UPF0319 family)